VAPESPLEAWRTFYQIVGASAGALTGLQFVVVALSAQTSSRRSEASVLAFGTPTVVHFAAVLLAAGILTAPWRSLVAPGVVLALCGSAGIAYTVIVIRRALNPDAYVPVFEDWVWHAAFPALAYGTQLLAALALPDHAWAALFWLGGVAMLLLLTGIHNAWDAAAYLSLAGGARPAATTPEVASKPEDKQGTP
jgi:hypothetical protein